MNEKVYTMQIKSSVSASPNAER